MLFSSIFNDLQLDESNPSLMHVSTLLATYVGMLLYSISCVVPAYYICSGMNDKKLPSYRSRHHQLRFDSGDVVHEESKGSVEAHNFSRARTSLQ